MRAMLRRWIIKPDGLLRDAKNDSEIGHVWANRTARLWEWRCLACGRLETLSKRRRQAIDGLLAHCRLEHSLS